MRDAKSNQQEQAGIQVLNCVLEYQLPAAQAAETMGVSECHTRRLLAAYRRNGPAALAHGNRGQRPHNAVPEAAATAVEKLAVPNMTRTARGTVEEPGTNVAAKSGLNREMLNQPWGLLRNQLAYQAAWAGREFVEVNPRYTSRECSECGSVTPQGEHRTHPAGSVGWLRTATITRR